MMPTIIFKCLQLSSNQKNGNMYVCVCVCIHAHSKMLTIVGFVLHCPILSTFLYV